MGDIKEVPGRIDNLEFVDYHLLKKFFHLNPLPKVGKKPYIPVKQITYDVDYKIVPLKAWNLLQSWYGGGPTLARSLDSDLFTVRIRPLCLYGVLYSDIVKLQSGLSTDSNTQSSNDHDIASDDNDNDEWLDEEESI